MKTHTVETLIVGGVLFLAGGVLGHFLGQVKLPEKPPYGDVTYIDPAAPLTPAACPCSPQCTCCPACGGHVLKVQP